MSKKFEFARFKNVVAHDARHTYSIFGIGLLIMSLMPLTLWIMFWAMNPFSDDVEVVTSIRWWMIRVLVTLSITLAPMVIYKNCNLPGRGNYFALLPASRREKFLSMNLFSLVVAPVVVFCGAFVVDTLLTLLPIGPFRDYLWHRTTVLGNMDIEFEGIFGTFETVVQKIARIVALGTLFMFANTIFKRAKFIKTILWLMLASFVVMVIALPIIGVNSEKIMNFFIRHSEDNIMMILFWCRVGLDMLLSALFIFLTSRRLKKMQY